MAGAIQAEANLLDQLSNHSRFRQEREFTTSERSRFESLLVHVVPEWSRTTVGRSRFESFDIQKVGQVKEYTFQKLRLLITNVKIYKRPFLDV